MIFKFTQPMDPTDFSISMPTTETIVESFGVTIIALLEAVDFYPDESLWIMRKLIESKPMKLALFSSPRPELNNQVMFQASSCGIWKKGFWKIDPLTSLDSNMQLLSENVRLLVKEFHQDTLMQKEIYMKEAVKANSEYLLNQ